MSFLRWYRLLLGTPLLYKRAITTIAGCTTIHYRLWWWVLLSWLHHHQSISSMSLQYNDTEIIKNKYFLSSLAMVSYTVLLPLRTFTITSVQYNTKNAFYLFLHTVRNVTYVNTNIHKYLQGITLFHRVYLDSRTYVRTLVHYQTVRQPVTLIENTPL